MLYEAKWFEVNEGDYNRRPHFCNWFLQAVHESVLDPEVTFFSDKAWCHWSVSGCIGS
jgi:hypothetical protein